MKLFLLTLYVVYSVHCFMVQLDINRLIQNIGENQRDIFICLVCCALMLYPTLFMYTEFFCFQPVYVQLLLIIGLAIVYISLSIPLNVLAIGLKGLYYVPVILLATTIILCISLPLFFPNIVSYGFSKTFIIIITLSHVVNICFGILNTFYPQSSTKSHKKQ